MVATRMATEYSEPLATVSQNRPFGAQNRLIGVMNIMLISVTERTAEIGLRLAVGARPADVLLQFLVEALTMTTVAGVMGLLLGFALSLALRVPVHLLAEYPAMPGAGTSIAAFAVVVVTGVVFGFYPALRASRLDPVVALRSE